MPISHYDGTRAGATAARRSSGNCLHPQSAAVAGGQRGAQGSGLRAGRAAENAAAGRAAVSACGPYQCPARTDPDPRSWQRWDHGEPVRTIRTSSISMRLRQRKTTSGLMLHKYASEVVRALRHIISLKVQRSERSGCPAIPAVVLALALGSLIAPVHASLGATDPARGLGRRRQYADQRNSSSVPPIPGRSPTPAASETPHVSRRSAATPRSHRPPTDSVYTSPPSRVVTTALCGRVAADHQRA